MEDTSSSSLGYYSLQFSPYSSGASQIVLKTDLEINRKHLGYLMSDPEHFYFFSCGLLFLYSLKCRSSSDWLCDQS